MRHAFALRFVTLAVGLSAAALMLGCDEVPTDVLADAPGPSLHHRPGHDGGPGGGGGGDDGDGGDGSSGTVASFADGLSAAAQAVDVKRDNKRSLETHPTSYTVTFALTNTADDASCVPNDVAMSHELEADLLAALSASATVDMDFEIDKDAALAGEASNDNFLRFQQGSLEPEPTVFIGRSGGPFLAVDFDENASSGGIDDGSATRVFRAIAGSGLVRVVQRVDDDGDGLDGGDPLADLVCPLKDDFTLTVAPAP